MTRVVAVSAMLVTTIASADPLPLPTVPSELQTPARLVTDGGAEVSLPAGWWIVPPSSWNYLDGELKGSQEDVTRLTAENKSLRESAQRPTASWWLVAGAAAVGVVAGAWAM